MLGFRSAVGNFIGCCWVCNVKVIRCWVFRDEWICTGGDGCLVFWLFFFAYFKRSPLGGVLASRTISLYWWRGCLCLVSSLQIFRDSLFCGLSAFRTICTDVEDVYLATFVDIFTDIQFWWSLGLPSHLVLMARMSMVGDIFCNLPEIFVCMVIRGFGTITDGEDVYVWRHFLQIFWDFLFNVVLRCSEPSSSSCFWCRGCHMSGDIFCRILWRSWPSPRWCQPTSKWCRAPCTTLWLRWRRTTSPRNTRPRCGWSHGRTSRSWKNSSPRPHRVR